jgi:cell division transport system permease protein
MHKAGASARKQQRAKGHGRPNYRYLVKQGFENRRRNKTGGWSSIAVLFVCLLLIGVAILVSGNLRVMMDTIEKENIIMVYTRLNTDAAQIDVLREKLENTANVESVAFISKEEALREQTQLLLGTSSEELIKNIGENPLPDAFRVSVKNMEQFGETAEGIKALRDVENVRENRELASKLTSLSRAASVAGVLMVLLLGIGSLLVVVNTSLLSMQKNEETIKAMRQFGGTELDIRFPFMVEGYINSILASALAFAVLWIFYAAALRLFQPILSGFFAGELASFGHFVWLILLGFASVVVVTGYLGSRWSVHVYLREEDKKKVVNVDAQV